MQVSRTVKTIYVLAPQKRLKRNSNPILIHSDILNLIFSRIAHLYSNIRATCKTWNLWFENKVNGYTPVSDDRYQRILQTVRILRISCRHFRHIANETGNISECLFDRQTDANSKNHFYYCAATVIGDVCNFQSNRAAIDPLKQVHTISGCGSYENRLWFVKHATYYGIHKYCEEKKIMTSLLNIELPLESVEYEIIQSEDFVVTITHRNNLQFRSLQKSKQFEVVFTSKIEKIELHENHVYVALSDGSVERLSFPNDLPEPLESSKVNPKRLRVNSEIKAPKKLRVAHCKNANGPQTKTNNLSKHKFYSISILASECESTNDYERKEMIQSDVNVKITALKATHDRLFIGKSNGSLSVVLDNTVKNFDAVHEGPIEDFATDGTLLFTISNFPTTIIKCHVIVSQRLELIAQFADTVPGRIFYGEGIFVKGRDSGGYVVHDFNFQNGMTLYSV